MSIEAEKYDNDNYVGNVLIRSITAEGSQYDFVLLRVANNEREAVVNHINSMGVAEGLLLTLQAVHIALSGERSKDVLDGALSYVEDKIEWAKSSTLPNAPGERDE